MKTLSNRNWSRMCRCDICTGRPPPGPLPTILEDEIFSMWNPDNETISKEPISPESPGAPPVATETERASEPRAVSRIPKEVETETDISLNMNTMSEEDMQQKIYQRRRIELPPLQPPAPISERLIRARGNQPSDFPVILFNLIKWFVGLCLMFYCVVTVAIIWSSFDPCPAKTASVPCGIDWRPLKHGTSSNSAAPANNTTKLIIIEAVTRKLNISGIQNTSDETELETVSSSVEPENADWDWEESWLNSVIQWINENCNLSCAMAKMQDLFKSLIWWV